MFTLPKEPQGIARILDNGFQLFKTGLPGALGIMLIMAGSAIVLSILLSLVMGILMVGTQHITPGNMTPGNLEQMPQLGLGAITIVILSMLAYGLFFTYFTSALIVYYAKLAYQGEANVGNALSGALSRLLPTFGALVLMSLFMLLMYLPALIHQAISLQGLANGEGNMLTSLLVELVLEIPYYLFGVTLGFTIYRAVLDNYGPVSAPIASHKLVWGNFWRTTLWLVIVYLIIGIVFLAVFYPLFGKAMFSPGGLYSISSSNIAIGVFAMLVLMLFVMPFVVAMTIPYYHDLKLRKEGGDLAKRVIAA